MKKIITFLLPVLIAVSFSSCRKAEELPLSVYQKGTTQIFLESVSDSRCPADPGIHCFWEGNAGVELNLSTSSGYATVTLNTHSQFENEATVLGYKIELVDVLPYPISDDAVDLEDYDITLVVTEL